MDLNVHNDRKSGSGLLIWIGVIVSLILVVIGSEWIGKMGRGYGYHYDGYKNEHAERPIKIDLNVDVDVDENGRRGGRGRQEEGRGHGRREERHGRGGRDEENEDHGEEN